ncbi:hypothetical protein COBT_002213, partial [Conglomerata obtusa]
MNRINHMHNQYTTLSSNYKNFIAETKDNDKNYIHISNCVVVYHLEAYNFEIVREEMAVIKSKTHIFCAMDIKHKNISRSYIRFKQKLGSREINWIVREHLEESISRECIYNKEQIINICSDTLNGISFLHENLVTSPDFKHNNIRGTRRINISKHNIQNLICNLLFGIINKNLEIDDFYQNLCINNIEINLTELLQSNAEELIRYTNEIINNFNGNFILNNLTDRNEYYGVVETNFNLKMSVSSHKTNENKIKYMLCIIIDIGAYYKFLTVSLKNDLVIKPIIYKNTINELIKLVMPAGKSEAFSSIDDNIAYICEKYAISAIYKEILESKNFKVIVNAKSIYHQKYLDKILGEAELVFKLHDFRFVDICYKKQANSDCSLRNIEAQNMKTKIKCCHQKMVFDMQLFKKLAFDLCNNDETQLNLIIEELYLKND